VLGAHAAAGGSARQTSYIEVQAAVDEAAPRREAAEQTIGELKAQLAEARARASPSQEA
jgi:chromosome segregation protein